MNIPNPPNPPAAGLFAVVDAAAPNPPVVVVPCVLPNNPPVAGAAVDDAPCDAVPVPKPPKPPLAPVSI